LYILERKRIVKAALLLAAGLLYLVWNQRSNWHPLRSGAPYFAPSNAPPSSAPAAFTIDLTGERSADNKRYALDALKERSTAVQVEGEQTVTLLHVVDEPLTFVSHGSFLDYLWGDLTFARLYLAPRGGGYAQAVQKIGDFLKRAKLQDRFDVGEYERHMGAIETEELWNGVIELPHAKLFPSLNCIWDWDRTARDQLSTVFCRPHITIERRGAYDAYDALLDGSTAKGEEN
jgi:hypothetical protein